MEHPSAKHTRKRAIIRRLETQCNVSPHALQQVVVERAKMTRSDVDNAECTTMKRKKSATITSYLLEARAGTALITDY